MGNSTQAGDMQPTEASAGRVTPPVNWFDAFPSCQDCRKPSNGILRGNGNASYGYHCQKCADKKLTAARRVQP